MEGTRKVSHILFNLLLCVDIQFAVKLKQIVLMWIHAVQFCNWLPRYVGMSSKAKKEARRKEALERATVERKRKKMDVRRGVTSWALTSETKCTMQLWVYLSNCNEWFLQQNSCLQNCYHPYLEHHTPRDEEGAIKGTQGFIGATTNICFVGHHKLSSRKLL